MRRETPEVNAGSMADIAFLLLIFWLVATAITPEKGVAETLKAEEDKVKIAVPTKASDIIRVYVTEDGTYEVEVNGTREMTLDEISEYIYVVKRRAGFKTKVVISAHYEAPYRAYVELLKLAEKTKTKTIETKIKEETEPEVEH